MAVKILALGHGVTKNWHNKKVSLVNSWHFANNSEGFIDYNGKKIRVEKGDVYILPYTVDYKLSQSEKLYNHSYLCFIDLNSMCFNEIVIIKKDDSLLYKTALYIKELIESISPLHHEGFYALMDFTDNLPEIKLIENLIEYFILNIFINDKRIKDKAVSEALLYIHKHYTEKITIDDIASRVFLNKNYFIKKFRDIIGMTPYEYITELRIGTVKTLSQSGLSVIEASERAGFSTTASYYRAVKNSKG